VKVTFASLYPTPPPSTAPATPFLPEPFVANLEHTAAWVGHSAFGQIVFRIGVSVGLAQSLWNQLKGLYLLPRTFVLAAQYQVALEARNYHLPSWVVSGFIEGVGSAFPLSAFSLGASLQEEKKAYDEVQALIRETRSLINGGAGKAWAQLKKFGGKKWQQPQADWDQYTSLMNSGSTRKMYEAGVLFGHFLGELLTTILLLLSVAGAAVRLARMALSGVRMLAELAGLVVKAEGTEIGTAAKALLDASAELQSARAAGNAERIAQAEKTVAEAAKDLQQKGEAIQQALEQNAPKLVKETGKLKDAKAKVGASGGGDVGAGEEGNDVPSRSKTARSPKPATNQPPSEMLKPRAPEGSAKTEAKPKAEQDPFDALAERRTLKNLPRAGTEGDDATLSRLEINGKTYDGINRGFQDPRTPMSLDRVNAQTVTHAEADAVQQAVNDGMKGTAKTAEMWVDRDPCKSCGPYGGLRSLARNLGVNQLTVHSPSGTQIFTPTK